MEEQRVQPARTCPRCNSDDTKFCYFNNYSLSQPRYFCKACRRYWTHGGSLRNVPVGGSSRKFKRRPRHFLPSPHPPPPPVVGPSSAVAVPPASCYFPLGLFSSLVAMQSMNHTLGGFEFGNTLWNEQKPFVSTSGVVPPVTGSAAPGDSCLRLDQWPEFLPGGDRN